MFGSIFNNLHALLTNRSRKSKLRLTTGDVFEDLFDGPPDPWYTELYYKFYRFFKYSRVVHWGFVYRDIKWFLQRGRRGWSDRDGWGLSSYLNGWMPEYLRQLKKYKHGLPATFILPEEWKHVDENGCIGPPKEAWDRTEQQWDEALDKMILGFEAGRRLDEGDWETELGAHPYRRPSHISRETWSVHRQGYHEKMMALINRDQDLLNEALVLFAKHYMDLCD